MTDTNTWLHIVGPRRSSTPALSAALLLLTCLNTTYNYEVLTVAIYHIPPPPYPVDYRCQHFVLAPEYVKLKMVFVSWAQTPLHELACQRNAKAMPSVLSWGSTGLRQITLTRLAKRRDSSVRRTIMLLCVCCLRQRCYQGSRLPEGKGE